VQKIVFDTNVYISAFITQGGRAHEAYLHAIDGDIEIYTSIPIITETAKKLRKKFQWDDERIADAIRNISAAATVRRTLKRIAILKDDPDNRVLECGVDADANIIVTGDKHLLKLKNYKGFKIITLAAFLKIIG
jgi:uncharacterized protein